MKTMLGIFIVTTANLFGQGTIVWDESVNGPLSQDFSNPTSLSPFQVGTNSIFGQTEVVPAGPNWEGHPDIFTIQVPIGFAVGAIYLLIDKPNVWIWAGDSGFSAQLAYSLNPSSGDLLSQWGLNNIGPGTYGMYLDNHDQQPFASLANYRLDFFVEAVPEPSTLSLLLVGAGLVGFHRWRKLRFKAK